MKTKCEGCGIKIQTIDPLKPGYIRSEVYLKNPDDFLCERCFNIKHYNKEISVDLDEKMFNKNIEIIKNNKGLVVNIIDVFDLEGTLFDNLNTMFPNNKIIIIANKFDLFLNSVKETKIRKYLITYLELKKIKYDKLILTSSKNDKDIVKIINCIDSILEYDIKINDIYFFGVTNVGKSTLLNKILKELNGTKEKITISNLPGTTLDMVKITLENKMNIFDTPGIINKHQFTYYLNKESLDVLIPKKYVKPIVFQLNADQSIIIGNFASISILNCNEKVSMVVNVSNEIPIHRTKKSNYLNYWESHKEDLLVLPNKDEIKRLGNRSITKYEINEKEDIAFSGLGFITITGNCNIEVDTYEVIKKSKREALI